MFFIVLDLRLTKVGVQRNSFFYALFRVIFPFVFVREKKTPLRFMSNVLAFFLKAEYVPENPFVSVRTIPFSLRAHTYVHARII